MKYILIFFVIITCLSCSKDDDCGENTGSTDAIPTCLYNYIFNTGSYWVYKDTNTTLIDSTYVTSVDYNWSSGKSGSGSCGVHISTTETIDTEYNSNVRSTFRESIIVSSINTIYGQYFLCGITPKDSIVLSTGTYYNVLDINYLDSVRLFYKEGVGVIRRVEYNPPVDTTTYDLINYQVSLFPVPQ